MQSIIIGLLIGGIVGAGIIFFIVRRKKDNTLPSPDAGAMTLLQSQIQELTRSVMSRMMSWDSLLW